MSFEKFIHIGTSTMIMEGVSKDFILVLICEDYFFKCQIQKGKEGHCLNKAKI